MIHGHARVPTDGQSVAAQVATLQDPGAGKVWREVASGAQTERAHLRNALAALDAGDVLLVTRLDRLARSTRDRLNTLATITAKKVGFRSLGDAWADTTTSHRRLLLTVLDAYGVRERANPCAHRRRQSAGRGARREVGPQAEAPHAPAARRDPAAGERRGNAGRDWPQL